MSNRKRHLNECRRRCAEAGILSACAGDLYASSGSDRIPVFHDAYPFCYHCFYLSTESFFGISSVLCADGSIFHMSRTEVDDIVWRILPYLSRELLSDEPVSSLHLTAMLLACPVLPRRFPPHRIDAFSSAHVARMKDDFRHRLRIPYPLAALESSRCQPLPVLP